MAMLFKAEEVQDWGVPVVQKATALQLPIEGIECFLSKKAQTLEEVMPELKPNFMTLYATGGLWSMHDLLFWILDRTGPAKVISATWSITEEPATQIARRLHEGLIQQLHFLFDVRVRIRNPKAFSFIRHQAATCRLSACHAKAFVVENDNWQVTVISSANFTSNPRIEAGVLLTHPKAGEFTKDWVMKEIQKGHPFH
jgi:hypothetical protein